MIVLDASAGVAIAANQPAGLMLEPSLVAAGIVCAPGLYRVEVASAAWKHVRAGLASQDTALALHARAVELVDTFFDDTALVRAALLEAIRLNHPVYDMVYLALARRTGASLCTLDRRLTKIAGQIGLEVIGPD